LSNFAKESGELDQAAAMEFRAKGVVVSREQTVVSPSVPVGFKAVTFDVTVDEQQARLQELKLPCIGSFPLLSSDNEVGYVAVVDFKELNADDISDPFYFDVSDRNDQTEAYMCMSNSSDTADEHSYKLGTDFVDCIGMSDTLYENVLNYGVYNGIIDLTAYSSDNYGTIRSQLRKGGAAI
jgi:hypothetical protein